MTRDVSDISGADGVESTGEEPDGRAAGGRRAGGRAAWARVFARERPRLLRLAYMTTGSLADAEGCVQETWLRLSRAADPARTPQPGAWLTATVGRIALDALHEARARRGTYPGVWLPEPLVEPAVVEGTGEGGDRWDGHGARDAHGVRDGRDDGSVPDGHPDGPVLDEPVSMALLVALDRLSPAQRAAYLLHDEFGLTFGEVAEAVGRTPLAARQLASRARKHVEDGRPRKPASATEQRETIAAFAAACQQRDREGLLALLGPGVVWRGDGGGKVPALPAPLRGAGRVARVLLVLGARWLGLLEARAAQVNGAPGLVVRDGDGVLSVVSFTLDAGSITALDVVRNPDKLRGAYGQEPPAGLPRQARAGSAEGSASLST